MFNIFFIRQIGIDLGAAWNLLLLDTHYGFHFCAIDQDFLAYFTADQNHLPGFFATMDNVDLL
jgi:hypothetical protein